MKAILLSIRPEWLVKILNREKTIEVRKLFRKDYVGWVYLYCSKGKPYLTFEYVSVDMSLRTDYPWGYQLVNKLRDDAYVRHEQPLNGKVVARFWCDKVEEIKLWYSPAQANNCVDFDVWHCETETLDEDELLYGSCLSQENLINYLCRKNNNEGFAIHISKLEIFDRPKELGEFRVRRTVTEWHYNMDSIGEEVSFEVLPPVKKAPQNYCYIEGEQL